MAKYTVTMSEGWSFALDVDLSQASAPISANFHDVGADADWQGTPFQTADASHCAHQAAKLVAEYFADGDDDDTDVESVDEDEDEDEDEEDITD